jgi:hypothetical protein
MSTGSNEKNQKAKGGEDAHPAVGDVNEGHTEEALAEASKKMLLRDDRT